MTGLELPLHFLPGNHDIGDCQDAPPHGEGTIDLPRRERYLRHFGGDWWSFDVQGWRVLGVNAQLLGSDPAEAEEQDADIAEAAATLVACGHVHQYRETWSEGARHLWAPSTAFVLPDRRQPRYGLKQLGYVGHRLEANGGHACRLIRVPGVPNLDIDHFPQAYVFLHERRRNE